MKRSRRGKCSDTQYMFLNSELSEINLSMNSHIDERILDSSTSFHSHLIKHLFDHLYESDHGHVVA